MVWADPLVNWVDGHLNDTGIWLTRQLKANPRLYELVESHFHAAGLHGPYVRHELRYRLLPVLLVVVAGLALLVAGWGRGRRRRRRA